MDLISNEIQKRLILLSRSQFSSFKEPVITNKIMQSPIETFLFNFTSTLITWILAFYQISGRKIIFPSSVFVFWSLALAI